MVKINFKNSIFVLFISFFVLTAFTIFGFHSKQAKSHIFVNKQMRKTENDIIHLFYFSDNGYAMPTATSIASLLKNSQVDDKIAISIVSFEQEPLSEENKTKIESLKNIKDFNLEFLLFDENKVKNFNSERWGKEVFVKLFATEIFLELDRVLWIDGDTVILGSLKELWNKNLENKYIAALPECRLELANRGIIKMTAGVVLFNLREMRKYDVLKQFLEATGKHMEFCMKECQLMCGPEEHALTALDNSKKLLLETIYNMRYWEFTHDCVILHYLGVFKPWAKDAKDKINSYVLNIWQEYYKMTPFYE